MSNPVLVEVTRGGIVESRHVGAYAVVGRDGQLLDSAGDIVEPVFPRSAVKAFQCLPVIESGAAGSFGFTDEDIALCCSSHSGEVEHVRVARAMLAKAGNTEQLYECGPHWPSERETANSMLRSGAKPAAIHNNCSGKHAGMLALARILGADPHGYSGVDHPVQKAIAARMGELCGIDLAAQPCGIDGCSVPTWAMPLRALALGFARFTDPANAAARRIIASVKAYPFMVAGTGRFCTRLMTAVPRAFVKTGAEGVFCACVPHAGIGVALKCDDGAGRAAEVSIAALLAGLDVWTAEEHEVLCGFARVPLANWAGQAVGEIRAAI